MKREWHLRLLIGIVVAVVILVGAALLPLSAAGNKGIARLGVWPTLLQTGSSVSGDYDGIATLQWVYMGTYDITSTTPVTMDMGYIDLSLHLDQSGTVISGYVTLDRALVFTREETIKVTPIGPAPGPGTPTPMPRLQDIGPRVRGTFDGATLRLESDPFSMSLNGRPITRRFSLTGSSTQDDDTALSGIYRETVWGYAGEPTTVVGALSLWRSARIPTQKPLKQVYLPLIMKK